MNKWTVTLSVALVAFGIVFSVAVLAQPEADDGPRYTNGTPDS